MVSTETAALNVTSIMTDSPAASMLSEPDLAATRATDGAPESDTVNTLTVFLPLSATIMRPDGSAAREDIETDPVPPPPTLASNENSKSPSWRYS